MNHRTDDNARYGLVVTNGHLINDKLYVTYTPSSQMNRASLRIMLPL